MASFTDTLVNFNPYYQQIPVDDYVRVGLIKQQEYDAGVEKVQSYIDSVAGIEVIKPEQKDYLDQRIGQLQSEVSKVVQRDFSNQQLVNSVGNLTTRIAKDPIIKNAEASTQRYKAGISALKAAREKGESGPSNEWYFQNAFQKWYTDGDVSSTFNGEFIKFTDVNKKVLAAIKELEPNSTLESIPYKRDNSGNIQMDRDGLPIIDYAMMEKSVKGITPERIQMAIRASLDQNDLRQLQIDGMYTYRALDKKGLKGVTDASYQMRLDQINDTIKSLLIDRQTNISDNEHIKAVDARINSLQELATKYQNKYKQDIGNLDANPEGYKSELYLENYLSRFGEGFAYSENSLTYKENPFFMAAERRRENDIRYQEFLINKQFQAQSLALQAAKLELDREELGVKKLLARAKIKKGETDEYGLPLSDAIPDAIDQGLLESINVDSYVAETDVVGEQLDTQKMALLAQVRPDLVGVVRSLDGTQRRYEYLVAGKDPNTVKNEADATVLKLRESYDKGEKVEDGVKTYFDNLRDATQTIDNRKFALGKLNKDADRDVGTIQPFIQRIPPLVMRSTSGATYTLTPEQQIAFNQKMKQVEQRRYSNTEKSYITEYDDKIAQRVFTTPGEKFLYSLIRKPSTERFRNPEEVRIVGHITGTRTATSGNVQGLIDRRSDYLNTAVRDMVGVTQPTTFTIEAFKAEDRNRAASVARELVGSMLRRDTKSPALPGSEDIDLKDASKMLKDDNLPGTSFSLVSKGIGKYAIRLTNNDISKEGEEIAITPQQANSLFGEDQFLDNFQKIRESLQLTRGTGRVTTDVQGLGRESAFKLNNGNINNYGVLYHVEEPLKNGGLQLRLYIYDKQAKQWLPDRALNAGSMLTESQITRLLSGLTDEAIKEIVERNK
jgi:hypothetical protein